MYTKCPKCGRILVDPGHDFECICGARIKHRKLSRPWEDAAPDVPVNLLPRIVRMLDRVIQLFCIPTYLVVLVLLTGVMLAAAPMVVSHAGELTGYMFLITPHPLAFAVLQGGSLTAYYVFLVAAVALSFGYMLYETYQRRKDIWEMLKTGARPEDASLLLLAEVFFAIIFFESAYTLLLMALGVNPQVPDVVTGKVEIWQRFYEFAQASVWEEIAARVILIGVPYMVYVSYARKDATPRDLLSALYGGHGDFSPVVVGLIVFSSVMFGAAHLTGWDAWKVLPTAVAGLGFAYLYVKKGVHLSIMLHFTFDYIGISGEYISGFFGGENLLLASSALFLLWAIFGLLPFYRYLRKTARHFLE